MNDFYTLDDVKDKVIVIKYGGSIMRNERCKKSFLQDLKLLHKHGARIVIVHGGGPMISAWLDRLNMGTEFIQGLRVTDEDTMEVVEMILSGNVNKNLASEIYLSGLPAVGISGKDSGLILARKKYLIDENGDPLDIGYVGDVEEVQSELLLNLLDCGRIPVISPVGADEYGYTYNINADYVAAFISGALKADHFIILTDVDGVYKDFNDKSSLISTINVKEISNLIKTKVIQGGMVPKLQCCMKAINMGSKCIHLINGTSDTSFIDNLLSGNGTIITGYEKEDSKCQKVI